MNDHYGNDQKGYENEVAKRKAEHKAKMKESLSKLPFDVNKASQPVDLKGSGKRMTSVYGGSSE